MIKTAHIFIICALMYASFVVAACGTSQDVEASRNAYTEGQALQDLKEARNMGAINHDEYEDAKEEILERYEE